MNQLIKTLLWGYLHTQIHIMHSFQKSVSKLVLTLQGKQIPVPQYTVNRLHIHFKDATVSQLLQLIYRLQDCESIKTQ
jgi:hypothetical protein